MDGGLTSQQVPGDVRNIELTSDIEIPVKKIRDTAKMFRRSPVYNEVLQKYIKADPDIGKKLQLKIDTRTRWNSLAFMLRRHLKVRYVSTVFIW